MIPSIVLKSVLWRCSESAWTFWKFQLLRFSLRPIVDPKQPLLSVRNVCPFLGKDIYPIMILSIVLESVVWRSQETAWAFCDFQKNLNSLRPTEQLKQPLLSVRNVCPFLGEDIHPRTIPSLDMKSALWRGSESARAFCNFQKSVNSLHPNMYYQHYNVSAIYVLPTL